MKSKTTAPILSIILILAISISFAYVFFKTGERKEGNPKIDNNLKAVTYKNISVDELKERFDAGKDFFLLDVHTPEQAHVKDTDEFIPFNEIETNITHLPSDKNEEIVVYCRSGSMSISAAQTLVGLGYTNVKNLSGGLNAWEEKGFEL